MVGTAYAVPTILFVATLVIYFTHRDFLLHLLFGKIPQNASKPVVFGEFEARFWEFHFLETSKSA